MSFGNFRVYQTFSICFSPEKFLWIQLEYASPFFEAGQYME